ncbi:NAD-dependent epimerase/dehydratase family protein [Polaribacter atrinae]|uniref:NAD-dependent epimerase/dehydratase family protein n=1 Tax=Polaribacter atrinae TaxID=1333662 RepID=UPI0030FCAE31
MKKRILVTGGSGFIGTNIIEFYKNDYEVLNIDIVAPRNINQISYWKEVDILDSSSLNKVFTSFKPDFVLHMAARTDLDGRNLEDYSANIKGVENVISATNNTPSIKKIIFASSRLVCEIGYEPKDEFDYKPSTIYGESKIIGEKIVRDATIENANWIIVRPTSLWGPWFGVPYKNFFDVIERKLYFHPQGEKIYKKFGFVLNCVYILNALLKDETLNKKTVYLSDFKELEVKVWADMISNCFHKTKVKQIPYFILKTFSVLGDLSKYLGVKNPPLTTFRLNNLTTQMSYNTLDVENVVKELPFTLEQGTNITYKWLMKKESIKI